MQRNLRRSSFRRRKRIGVIACEPDDQEPMTFRGAKRTVRELISTRLRDLGLEPIIHRPVKDKNDFPSIGRCDGIVIGGSKLDIFDKDLKKYEWMGRLLEYIREAHTNVPILGICFGHQAIGRAFGAELKRYGPEVGYEVGLSQILLMTGAKSDYLFRNMPNECNALFSHFSYLANTPPGALELAVSSNPRNPSVQAFRLGNSTWSVQFHPEYHRGAVRDLVVARREKIKGMVDCDRILEDLDNAPRADDVVLTRFAQVVDHSYMFRKRSRGFAASRRASCYTRHSQVPS